MRSNVPDPHCTNCIGMLLEVIMASFFNFTALLGGVSSDTRIAPYWVVLHHLSSRLLLVLLLHLHVRGILVFSPLIPDWLNDVVIWVNFVGLQLLHLLILDSILELLMDGNVRRFLLALLRWLPPQCGLQFYLTCAFERELDKGLLFLSSHHDGDTLLWCLII